MAQWGTLSYIDVQGNSLTHDIKITSIDQQQSLEGQSYQSRSKRHFYPRSHMPGDILVAGICSKSNLGDGQQTYQALAAFIRHHQRVLLGVPSGNFQFKTNAASKSLLTLNIPTENSEWQGFIKQFGMVKKGVYEPAPTYLFNFFVVFDNSSVNIGISNRVSAYYTAGAQTPPPPNLAQIIKNT